MLYFFIFALIIQVDSDVICEKCVCDYDSKASGDFEGQDLDCSYSVNFLDGNYSLPDIARSLDLSSSNISTVHSGAIRSKTLAQLYLNDNRITAIATDGLQLPNLTILDLSDNLLEFIDKTVFKNLRNLQSLDLTNNRFTTFAKLTFHSLSNLRELVLDNNAIGPSLHEASLFDRRGFGLTAKIRTLSLSGINLNTVPDNFFVDAYDVRKLVMSNNNITDVFELPFTLEYLDLSDNPIEEIEGEDFNDLPALKELLLNNLAIKEVPEFAFSPLRSLITLELERNKNLTEFSKLAFGREVLDDPDDFVLESLSVSGSRLWRLDEELMQPLGQLTHLDLQGNPWKCDCNLVWLKELQIPENDYDHLRCATPKHLFNARIFELQSKYFVCPPNKSHVGVAISIVALCTMLATIAIWLFFCLPKLYSRSRFLRQMYTPSAAYTVLPMSTTISSVNDL